MYEEDFAFVSKAAQMKSALLKSNFWGYVMASILGGLYVGLGTILIYSVGGMFEDLPYAKIVMGLSFGISISLVVIAGAELFTGNNLVMAIGALKGSVMRREAVKVCIVCYFGNWFGSILLAILFWGAGLSTGSIGEFIATTSAAKMGIPIIPLLLRGILCNILVCLAVWCSFRCKSESGKLIMIFWCLFAFITSNFENSIANMTLLTIGMLAPFEVAISWSGYFYNIIVVTLGNILGGMVFIAIPYFLISQKKDV